MGAIRTMVNNESALRMARCYRDGLARLDLAEQADPRTHRFFHGYVAGLRDMGQGLFGIHGWDALLAQDTRSIFDMEREAQEAGVDNLLSFMAM